MNMKFEAKLLFFYLSLDEREQVRFRSLLGPKIIDTITSSNYLREAIQSMENVAHAPIKNTSSWDNNFIEDYDIAVMQLVRYIGQSAPSNIELAESVSKVIGKHISRAGKRSRYELQGMLLEALMNAKRDTLINLRNEMIHGNILGSHGREDSNLDRWFSIILDNMK